MLAKIGILKKMEFSRIKSELKNIIELDRREKFEVKTDPTRIRKIDIPVLFGNGNKFSNLTGWQPKIKFGKTLEDLLNYWRAKI